MEIRHLKLIRAVAEYKSLTRAASKLFLTQSALSHQVKEIEEEYNTKFFLRLNKQMILTPAGERLLKTAHDVLDIIQKTNDDFKRLSAKDAGVLRISTQCYTCYQWLSSFLKKFRQKYPNVEIRIVAEATRKTIEALEEGKLEIAIVHEIKESGNINYSRLFEDEMHAVFSKEHPWAAQKNITPEDFVGQTYLMYCEELEESATFKYLFNSYSGIYPSNILKIQLTEAIIELAKANLGVAVLAKWSLTSYSNSSDLGVLPIGEEGYKRTWYAATLANEEMPKYMKEFIEDLSKHTLLIK